MKLLQTIIPDCFELTFDNRVDSRGNFVKTSHASVLAGLGLECNFRESFYTRSAHNVLRGMHLQLAPADGAKLVYCLQGAILDLALDLRPDSAAFGEVSTFELSEATTTAAYIPCGVAHGFYVLEGPALMMYHVTSEFNPQLDAGVRWDSFGFDWPCTNPHLSARDIALPTFAEFTSRQPPKSICHR